MSTPSPEELEARKKRTVWLLAGGAFSLILPLAGVAYIRFSESKTARAPNSAVMFDRREVGESKINVSQTVALTNAPGTSPIAAAGSPAAASGGSLGFVKGSGDYYQEKKEAPAPSTPTVAAAPPAPAPEPAPKAPAKKSGKKEFVMPHLQGTKSISSFKSNSSPRPTGGGGMAGVLDPKAAGKGGGDMADLLKNVPGGADNPDVQKLLKSQGK